MKRTVYRAISLNFPLIALLAAPTTVSAQVFHLGELNTRQFRELDRDRTAIIMPLGVIEEHGPYLPLLTDSYTMEWLGDRVANEIVRKQGWTVVIMPSLPIGVGAPEDFGPRSRDYGSLPLRPETKRAVLMDLVTGLGDSGFRWIFALDNHGPFVNKRMTDDASEYFEDTYGGTMINLVGVADPDAPAATQPLSEAAQAEDGLAVHAGLTETSNLMYVRPDLYDQDVVDAEPVTPDSWEDYEDLPNDPDWPGYFGSPRLASAEIGADRMEVMARNASDLAVRIIQGQDHADLTRLADGTISAILRLEDLIQEQATRVREQQEQWMERNNIQ